LLLAGVVVERQALVLVVWFLVQQALFRELFIQ
jgi:hypothetical protein